MKKYFLLLIFLTTLLSGCNNSTRATNPRIESLKIGVIATLTGVGHYQGQQEIRGLELAREKINQAGGIGGRQLELIVEDSKAKPEEAVKAMEKLINVDQVEFVIGDSWSSTTVVLVPLANANQVLLISPLALLDELAQDDMFFRTMPTTREMMKVLAEYSFDALNSRRVGILRQATPFGAEHANDFKHEFENLGGQIVGEESFELTQADLRTEILKIKSQKLDTILNLHATGGAMIGVLIKQAQELGLEVNWISSFGAQNAPLVKEFGEVVEGLVYPYPYDESLDIESVREFVDLYQIKYNELPDLTAANSYDALMLLAQAIDHVGEDTSKVKEYLLNIQDYRGASGVLSFDKNGDVEKPIVVKQIKNGEFVKVSE